MTKEVNFLVSNLRSMKSDFEKWTKKIGSNGLPKLCKISKISEKEPEKLSQNSKNVSKLFQSNVE